MLSKPAACCGGQIPLDDRELLIRALDHKPMDRPTARHFCGEAHAETYISRWFESVCVPSPKRVLKAL